MNDEAKTKEQLIIEIKALHKQIADLEALVEIRHTQVEEKLKAVREYSQNIIDSSNDMIISVDNDRRIVEFNRAAEENFGYRKEEVLGKHVSMLYKDPGDGEIRSKKARDSGEMVSEITNVRKDGSTFPAFLSATVLKNTAGEVIGVMGISRDMTDRKRAEEERLQRERLEGVLELAGAACHELNQPMQTISIYLELILVETPEDSQFRERLKTIQKQIARMSEITGKLRKITKYETREYVGGIKIFDIDKSSE
ncbi:MAG: PAS domain S-box protein [Deltaproteobacteria bacterium]|nr:PAS domain S-box protein [Deltaproteobacteria bacterium]MBW2115759.1 PAS domain S-box protein [Deltaproteobacteria bacterium]